MDYKVDYDALNSMSGGILSQVNKWAENINALQSKIQDLIKSANMSGTAADNIRAYMANVHESIISSLFQLITLHSRNCMIYIDDYHTTVDNDLHAKIWTSEINYGKGVLETQRSNALSVDGAIRDALSRIRDIFYVSYQDVTYVYEAHSDTIQFLRDTNEKIDTLEQRHKNGDFSSTEELINTIRVLLNEQLSFSRAYKTDFSVDKYFSGNSFQKLCEANVAVADEMDEKAGRFEAALENEVERQELLQKEYEDRQKVATAINVGVCIVLSTAAIVLTAGTATPLVAGAVSAVSAATIAGTANLTMQYVEHGNLVENADKIDWGSFGKDVAIAGAVGFISGAVGQGIKGGAEKFAGKLLKSNSMKVRIGAGAAIGATTNVSENIISRGGTEFLSNGFDIGNSFKEALNIEKIAKDAMAGCADGAFEQVVITTKAQKNADKTTKLYNEKYDPFDAGKEKGLSNIKKTKNSGVDFSDSDYILRMDDGTPIEVKIKSTGNRNKDYKLAEEILKNEYGIDIDFKSMRTGSDKTHVWHHLDDYNAFTNETTMQFIDIDAHRAIENHAGSAKQYHVAHNTGYGKQEKREYNYEGFGIITFINNADSTKENLSEISDRIDELNDINDYFNNAALVGN